MNSDFGYLNQTSYFFQRGTNISKVQMISCHQQKREAMAVFYVILTYFKTMKYRLRNQSSDTQQEKKTLFREDVRGGACVTLKSVHVLIFIYFWSLRG